MGRRVQEFCRRVRRRRRRGRTGGEWGGRRKNGATKNGCSLKDDEDAVAVAADDEEEEEGRAHRAQARFLKRIRTDMLLGTWLCRLRRYLFVHAAGARPPRRRVQVARVRGGVDLRGGLCVHREAAYPASLIGDAPPRLAADAAADAELTCVEKWLLNPMLLGTQLANLGMLPYLIEGFVLLGRGRPGDEEMGWSTSVR